MEILDIIESQFQKQVLECDKLTVVNFWSNWCVKCTFQGVILDEMNKESHDLDVRLAKVRIDENTSLIERYDIKGLPLLLFFWKGQLWKID